MLIFFVLSVIIKIIVELSYLFIIYLSANSALKRIPIEKPYSIVIFDIKERLSSSSFLMCLDKKLAYLNIH